MSSDGLSPDGEGPSESTAPSPERPLPLRDLERVLGPVRRVVRFALTAAGASAVRYLESNLRRLWEPARTLELPEILRERLRAIEQHLDGFDVAGPDAQRVRLSAMYAELARVDLLTGLPVPIHLRPIPKVTQIDEPDAPPPRAAPEAPPQVTRSVPAPEEAEDEGEDEIGGEFAGDLGTPLGELPISADLADALTAAGIHTVRDLALCRPTWSDVLTVHGAGRDPPADDSEPLIAFGGRLRMAYTVFHPGRPPTRGALLQGSGLLRVEWGDGGVPVDAGAGGHSAVIVGRLRDGVLVDAEIVSADEHGAHLGRWDLPEGIPDRAVRAIWASLSHGLKQGKDPLHPALLDQLDLPPLGAAILGAQLSRSEPARRRLAFEEVLLAQLASALPRTPGGRERGVGHVPVHAFAARLGQLHELVLYDAAQLELEEIKRDLRRSTPMRRVLTGEVGSGKGLVALIAGSMVAESKSQVLVLGSTPAEVEHRFLVTEPLLREGGLVARLVTSPPSKAQLDAIKRGEVHVVFGTIDLLEQEIEFRRLGLVVATERERFGRAGVLHNALPAPRPDLLVTTAVPVGPHLLMSAYADFQISVLVDPARRPAVIHLCRAEERDSAYAAIRSGAALGRQALVVFPLVEGSDAVDIPEAHRVLRALEQDVLAGLRVGLLHGASSREDRAKLHDDLVHRRIDVLVTTTTFEEGPSVPGLCTVVVEQADRVDQIRLHRIIGYMSRAAVRADAFLVVGEMADPGAAARIDRVLAAPNGFQLTEALVRVRGLERLAAAGIAPYPEFTWFEADTDLGLLLAAREEAHRIVRADPQLRRSGHAELGQELAARWSRLFPDAGERGWICPVRDEPGADPRRRRRRRRRRRT